MTPREYRDTIRESQRACKTAARILRQLADTLDSHSIELNFALAKRTPDHAPYPTKPE